MFTCSRFCRFQLMALVTMGLFAGLQSTQAGKTPPPPPPTYEYTIELLDPLYDAAGNSMWLSLAAINSFGDVVGHGYTDVGLLGKGGIVGFLYVADTGEIRDLDGLILGDANKDIVFSGVSNLICDYTLNPANATIATARGVNDFRQITGVLKIRQLDLVSFGDYAFRYTPASVTGGKAKLEVIESVQNSSNQTLGWTCGSTINNAGTVVGTAANRGNPPSITFIWEFGQDPVDPALVSAAYYGSTGVGFVTDSGLTTGCIPAVGSPPALAHGPIAFVYSPDYATFIYYVPFGKSPTQPAKISIGDVDQVGNVAGVSSTNSTTTVSDRAFIGVSLPSDTGDTTGVMRPLGCLDNTSTSYSVATGIRQVSALGQTTPPVTTLVGHSSLLVSSKRGVPSEIRVFVHTDSKGMRDLFGLIDPKAFSYPVGLKGADLSGVYPKINEFGQIAGTVANSSYQGTSGLYSGRLWIATPIPKP
jgi:hypothetical protein